MSFLNELTKPTAGPNNAGNQQVIINDCSLIYIPIYAVMFIGTLISIVLLSDISISIENRLAVLNNFWFWFPLLYFLLAADYSGWYLFESSLLKTILPLPVDSNDIYKRYTKFATLIFPRVIVSLISGIIFGFYTQSFLWALPAFIITFCLCIVLEKLALIAIPSIYKFFLKFRKIIFLIPAVIFLVSILFMLPIDSPISKSSLGVLSNIVSINLLPLSAPWYVWIIISIAFFLLAKILKKTAEKSWKKKIHRQILINTAFPLVSSGSKRRYKTIFDIWKRNLPLIKRSTFLFGNILGTTRIRRITVALLAALILPQTLLLLNLKSLYASVLFIPALAIAIFCIIGSYKNTPGLLANYSLPVSFLESETTSCIMITTIFISSGIETIAMVEFLKYCGVTTINRPYYFQLLDLAEATIIFATWSAALIGLSQVSLFKKSFRSFYSFSMLQLSSLLLGISMIIGFVISCGNELSLKFHLKTPIWKDSLAIGIKFICIFINSIIEFSSGTSIEKTFKTACYSPTSGFILPAWTLLISTCLLSWYFFVKYGRKVPKYSLPGRYLNVVNKNNQ